jgi:stage II sporulation SpoAA-like protein
MIRNGGSQYAVKCHTGRVGFLASGFEGDAMADADFRVEDDGSGVIRASVRGGWVDRPLAEALCTDIERAAKRHPGEARLLMDMGALSKATPGAGLYAMRRMKQLDLSAIALFRANGFMRSFAQVVMRLAGFRSYRLFGKEADARAWLAGGSGTQAPAGGSPADPGPR